MIFKKRRNERAPEPRPADIDDEAHHFAQEVLNLRYNPTLDRYVSQTTHDIQEAMDKSGREFTPAEKAYARFSVESGRGSSTMMRLGVGAMVAIAALNFGTVKAELTDERGKIAAETIEHNVENVLSGKGVDPAIIEGDVEFAASHLSDRFGASPELAVAASAPVLETYLGSESANTAGGMLVTLAASEKDAKLTPEELRRFGNYEAERHAASDKAAYDESVRKAALGMLSKKLASGETVTIPDFDKDEK